MIYQPIAASLMLVASTLSTIHAFSIHSEHIPLHVRHLDLAGRDRSSTSTFAASTCSDVACPTSTSTVSPTCGKANDTEFAGTSSMWTLLCDTDFVAQDIFPFILAQSFQNCMKHCENYNEENGEGKCAGFVYAPDRSGLENDCYLKSGLENVVYPASIHLIGASLRSTTATSTIIVPIPTDPGSTARVGTAPSSSSSSSASSPSQITDGTTPGEGLPRQRPNGQGKIPTVTNSTFLGTSVDEVASHFVSHAPAKPQQLAADMLETGINVNLITGYSLASDTGSWTSDDSSENELAAMKVSPRLSRDGGRGGNINGTNVFIFCDTSTYGKDKDPLLGYLNGFVSSSVAIDESMNGLEGQPLKLVNSLGQWQDDVGRMRGWVPMTTGEEAFNTAVSGQGYRYAVWPNSSPLPLNNTHAIVYAPLVYLEVDMQDQSSPRYTSLGNTLLLVTIDPVYGPHADRLYNQFFTQDDINWGSIGGIRAWSSQGRESTEGDIYVFGQEDRGILVGKVAAQDFSDQDKYTYWNGNSWSSEIPLKDSTANAFLIEQPVMNMDLFYSPVHKTFIMIYLTPLADNTFYYRYLIGKDNSTLSIIPPYEEDGSLGYVENIVSNSWSEEKILFRVSTPARGFAYAGGIHAGYFGDSDITNGGTKILITWTEHTVVDPDKPNSGYAHNSQIVELGWEG